MDDNLQVAGAAGLHAGATPRDTATTITRATVAVDSQTGVPLRLDVYGAATKPAFEIGFDSVSFDRPAASTFTFTAPAGAKVTTHPFGAAAPGTPGAHRSRTHRGHPDLPGRSGRRQQAHGHRHGMDVSGSSSPPARRVRRAR